MTPPICKRSIPYTQLRTIWLVQLNTRLFLGVHSVYASVTSFGLRSSLFIYIHLQYFKDVSFCIYIFNFIYQPDVFLGSKWSCITIRYSIFICCRKETAKKRLMKLTGFGILGFFWLIPQCHNLFKRVGYQPTKVVKEKKLLFSPGLGHK